MRTKYSRTLDREWLLETIEEERVRVNSKKKKKKKKKSYNFTVKFYVIWIILSLLFFSYIAPIMD